MKLFWTFALGPVFALIGCGTAESTADAPADISGAKVRQAAESTATETPSKPVVEKKQHTQRSYDGLTLTEWRARIKDLDPANPDSDAAVSGLIDIMIDPTAPWFSRRQAAQTLGRIGSSAKKAIPLLADLLDQQTNADDPTFVWATKALALFGPVAKQAAPVLAQQLRDESVPIDHRRVTIDALARIGAAHPAVVPVLIETLNSSSDDPMLCQLAAEALGLVGPQASAAVPALMRATRQQSESLRRTSAMALGAMGSRAEPAVPALVELLAFDPSAAVRDQAAEALARIGLAAASVLQHLLEDDDAKVRWRAAASIGKIRPPAKSAAQALTAALRDESPQVRMHAAESLWIVSPDAETIVPALLAEFENEDRQIRIRAFRLLIGIGPAAGRAVDPLRKMLDDRRGYVRQIAAKALEKLRSNE